MITLRVYGILVNEKNEVLVSDEYIRETCIPNSQVVDLNSGEGTRDCLAREFMEEMNLKVEVGDHLYTTDFFQISAFNTSQQIVSIYYKVRALESINVPLRDRPFDFDEQQLAVYHQKGETETFRMIPMEEFGSASVSLPIDKVVAEMVKSSWN